MNNNPFIKITENESKANGVVSLAIRPNLPSQYGEGSLSGKQLQQKFDSLANLIIGRYNSMAEALSSDEVTTYFNLPGGFNENLTLGTILTSTFNSKGEIVVNLPVSDVTYPSDTTVTLEEAIDLIIAAITNVEGNLTAKIESKDYQELIKGDPGEDGKDGIDGDKGAPGVGIKSIEQTTTSTDDNGENVFTVTLNDANQTQATFKVRNGSKGTNGRPFRIEKFYANSVDMYKDTKPIEIFSYCLIRDNENPSNAENGHLYMRVEDEEGKRQYQYISDMDSGIPVDGIGIEDITINQTDEAGAASDIIISLTDGTTKKTVYVYNGNDGNGVQSIDEEDLIGSDSKVKGKTITVKYTNGKSDSFEILNGVDGATITDVSQTTENGVNTISFTLSNGVKKEVTILDGAPGNDGEDGEDGKDGKPFQIAKTYKTKADMETDANNGKIEEGTFVMVDRTEPDDAYKSSLWTLTKNDEDQLVLQFVASLLGATGIPGSDGIDGKDGVGIEEVVSSPIYNDLGRNGKEVAVINTNGKNIGSFQIFDGVGIRKIEQIESSSDDGGINTVRFYLNDKLDSSYDINIRNGSNVIYTDSGSKGLWYRIVYDETAYAVCWRKGLCTDTEIRIGGKANGATVTGVGESAFQDDEEITKVILPESVAEIASKAFLGCKNLETVEGMTTVSKIGAKAFSGCKFASFTAPNSVTSIGKEAFDNCTHLTTITFPGTALIDGVEEGIVPFIGCEKLDNITVEELTGKTNYYRSVDGNLYKLDTTNNPIKLIRYAIGKNNAEFTVPSDVQYIGQYAFYGAKYLENITFTQIKVGESAFEDCTNLRKIIIPDNTEEIPARAFKGCAGMNSVLIPNSVKTAKENAFEGCNTLKAVKDEKGNTVSGKIYYKGNKDEWSAFVSNIESGNDALLGATVYYFSEDTPPESGDWWRYVDGEVSEWGELDPRLTYTLNTEGTAYIITKGEVLVGELTTVTIPPNHPDDGKPIVAIGDSAFKDTAITSVFIGTNITTIGANAFENCQELTGISIPGNVKSIGDYAFKNCSGITEISIGSGVETLYANAFSGCTSLETINVDSANNYYASSSGVLTDVMGEELIKYPANSSAEISDSITSIGAYAYEDCKKDIIHLPLNVTEIGAYAFKNCTNLERIDVYDALKKIGENVFIDCDKLKSIYFYGDIDDWNTLIDIDESNKEKLKRIRIIELNPSPEILYEAITNYYENPDIPIAYMVSGIANLREPTEITIPDTYNGLYVTEIATVQAPFSDTKYLTKITIPAHVKKIRDTAFLECENLTTVIFGDGSDLEYIGLSAFKNCKKLEKITIPKGVTRIESYTFKGCNNLTEISGCENVKEIGISAFQDCGFRVISTSTFPNLEIIGETAFLGCSKLQSALFDKVRSIGTSEGGSWAFSNCINLVQVGITGASMTFPPGEDVVYIGPATFANCTALNDVKLTEKSKTDWESFIGCQSLTDVQKSERDIIIREREYKNCGFTKLVIPDNIHTISNQGFQDCLNLTEVIIPVSVKRIGTQAFAGCPLKNVYYRGKEKEWKQIEGLKESGLSDNDPTLEFKYEGD